MNYLRLVFLALMIPGMANAQQPASVKESKKVFTTYPFSDPNPIPEMGKIYPYYRFDGYTTTSTKKEWKIVELENDYIKVMILPEIGGKIWTAWDKATGKPFLYYNEVVKFRDVAMRGPWTSGGIEPNYGIIGHTPNCATPMDYFIRTNEDGSASCFVGTLDLLTQTYWTIEVNLPRDKAYFTTRSFWSNTTAVEQPYYHWMNVGMPSDGNLQFIYPGTQHLEHDGTYADWTINRENGKDISYHDNNNFGGPKSYHIIGNHSDFFGAYYHDQDFGMARYSLRDDKPGSKIWIWGLSRNGMIWEDLLTDNNGQYVEVQSGRLFNQAADRSNYTPFKQLGFAPHSTDTWTEYWYPVKGTKGFVKANHYGALNLRANKTSVRIDFSPVQPIDDELHVLNGDQVIYTKHLKLSPLQAFADSVNFSGNVDDLTVVLGGNKLRYQADPKAGVLARPLDSPKDFDWNSTYGLYSLGKEYIQQRYYPRAEETLKEVLKKDPHFVPALVDLAMLAYRNLDYTKALEYARHALSIDTYEPGANFYYGVTNDILGNTSDAMDGFEIASLSPAYRGAAYTELSRIYFREGELARARHYAERSLESNALNTLAWQILAVAGRSSDDNTLANTALKRLGELNPLNHFPQFEQYRAQKTDANRNAFERTITNELPHETYLELADFYTSMGLQRDALDVLALSPTTPEILYRMAYLTDQLKTGNGTALLEQADKASADQVFPFRASSVPALEWASTKTDNWKPKYFLGLIHWSRDNTSRAKALFTAAGNPEYAPFYAARAVLFDNENYAADVRRAAQLDPRQWRYGKLLAERLIASGDYAGALTVARDYQKRFPRDFRIGMLTARALVLNKQYKATVDLLQKITILPYEGANDGRLLFREAWLMQAAEQIKSRKYKTALASIEKAKLWPENLGAGKPYDDMIDLRIENYVEALALEKSGQSAQAKEKFRAVIEADQPGGRHRIRDLATALAYRKTGREAEGKKLLADWLDQQPDNKLAKWSKDAFAGQVNEVDVDVRSDDYRILRTVIGL